MGSNARPVFGLDVDSVILDISTAIDKAIGKMYNMKNVDWMSKYNTIWDFGIGIGLPKEDLPKFEETWLGIPAKPYPGAKRFVARLQGMGYEVVGITKRHTLEQITAGSRDIPALGLDRWFPVEGTKSHLAVDLRIDYMVDDKIGNLLDIYEAWPQADLFLLDRPWNASYDLDVPYTRVYDYDQIIQNVKEDEEVAANG